MTVEDRLAKLGLQLPPAPKPAGVYKPVLIVDNMAYVSGHGPVLSDGSLMTGRVGADLDLDAGKAAAQQTGLAILASRKARSMASASTGWSSTSKMLTSLLLIVRLRTGRVWATSAQTSRRFLRSIVA